MRSEWAILLFGVFSLVSLLYMALTREPSSAETRDDYRGTMIAYGFGIVLSFGVVLFSAFHLLPDLLNSTCYSPWNWGCKREVAAFERTVERLRQDFLEKKAVADVLPRIEEEWRKACKIPADSKALPPVTSGMGVHMSRYDAPPPYVRDTAVREEYQRLTEGIANLQAVINRVNSFKLAARECHRK